LTEKKSLTLARPDEVLGQIREIKTRLADGFFELADLLAETKREAYYEDWGYESFGEWVETSGLDLSERQAWYMISLSDKSKALGIGRDELKNSTITKLKAIFSLGLEDHAEDIKLLVADSATESLDQITLRVSKLKAAEGQEPMVHKSFSFTLSGYENTVKGAIELMQQEYGDTINYATGEIDDISPGRAIEMLCADYLAGGAGSAHPQ
jgi:hypothetical protein